MSWSRVFQTVIDLALLLLLIAGVDYAQSTLAEKPMGQFFAQNAYVSGIAIQLATKASVPIGIENLPGAERKVDFSIEDATLGRALDTLIALDSRYQWKETQGVIDILPKDHHASVFDVLIERFDIENASSPEMVQQLLKTKAVSEYLRAHRITAGTWMAGSVSAYKLRSLAVRNETLRDALNHALTQTQSCAWSSSPDHRDGVDYLWFQAW